MSPTSFSRGLLLVVSLVGLSCPVVVRADDDDDDDDDRRSVGGYVQSYGGSQSGYSSGGDYSSGDYSGGGYSEQVSQSAPTYYENYGGSTYGGTQQYGSESYGNQPQQVQPQAQPEPQNIALVNPAENRQTIKYYLGDEEKTLEPGEMESLVSVPVVVDFERGGRSGLARYTVSNGMYEFRRGPQGWDLKSKICKVRIDNTQGTEPLQYQIDGKTMTVAPGFFSRHTGRFPIAITYDPGDGSSVRKTLQDGTYMVTQDPQSGRLDLLSEAELAALLAQQEQAQQPGQDFPQGIPGSVPTTPTGFPPQTTQQSPYTPVPQDYAPQQQYSPQQYPPQQYVPQRYPNQQLPPQQYAPQQYAPQQQYPPQQTQPQGGPTGFGRP